VLTQRIDGAIVAPSPPRAASHLPGLLMRRTTPALSYATTPGRRSGISISRMSPADDQRPSCSPGTMRGGWRSTSPNCRSYCGGRRHPSKSPSHRAATQRFWSLLGDKRTLRGHPESVAPDPSLPSAAKISRVAPRGSLETDWLGVRASTRSAFKHCWTPVALNP